MNKLYVILYVFLFQIIIVSGADVNEGRLNLDEVGVFSSGDNSLKMRVYVSNIGLEPLNDISVYIENCQEGWSCSTFDIETLLGEEQKFDFLYMNPESLSTPVPSRITVAAKENDTIETVEITLSTWCETTGLCTTAEYPEPEDDDGTEEEEETPKGIVPDKSDITGDSSEQETDEDTAKNEETSESDEDNKETETQDSNTEEAKEKSVKLISGLAIAVLSIFLIVRIWLRIRSKR